MKTVLKVVLGIVKFLGEHEWFGVLVFLAVMFSISLSGASYYNEVSHEEDAGKQISRIDSSFEKVTADIREIKLDVSEMKGKVETILHILVKEK